MPEFCAPAAYAVLVWWFATGLILFLDGLPQRSFRWSMAGATAILVAAFCILPGNALDTTTKGAYTAFTCAVLIWGWLEMSFLMGFITGPRRHACIERCSGWRHFVHATQAIIYNEIATVIGALGVFIATRHGPNRLAFWTFALLWVMRISAKLNLFLGVPNLGEKFLPPHLQYLKMFFRKRTMNFLFPVSITASTLMMAYLLQKYLVSSDPFHNAGYVLLISLLALAVLEHWFMVLPLPSEKLWNWARGSVRDARAADKLERRIAAKSP